MGREKIRVKCPICGKELLKCPSDAKRFKVCSLECRGKYSADLYTKKIAKNCEVCGDEFYVKPSHYGSRFTCSTECKYTRLEDHLSSLSGSGESSVNWKGGRVISPSGYVFIHAPSNPMSNSRGYVREHRLVMSNYLGRPLRDDEIVHHLDENKQNNNIENLVLMTSADHTRLHTKDREFARDEKGRITGINQKEESRMIYFDETMFSHAEISELIYKSTHNEEESE